MVSCSSLENRGPASATRIELAMSRSSHPSPTRGGVALSALCDSSQCASAAERVISRRPERDLTAARHSGAYSITASCSPASCMSASAPPSCDAGTGEPALLQVRLVFDAQGRVGVDLRGGVDEIGARGEARFAESLDELALDHGGVGSLHAGGGCARGGEVEYGEETDGDVDRRLVVPRAVVVAVLLLVRGGGDDRGAADDRVAGGIARGATESADATAIGEATDGRAGGGTGAADAFGTARGGGDVGARERRRARAKRRAVGTRDSSRLIAQRPGGHNRGARSSPFAE